MISMEKATTVRFETQLQKRACWLSVYLQEYVVVFTFLWSQFTCVSCSRSLCAVYSALEICPTSKSQTLDDLTLLLFL